MSYVIKRLDQGGGWVSEKGSLHSYTLSILKARRFPNRESAQHDACGNETVERISQYLDMLRSDRGRYG